METNPYKDGDGATLRVFGPYTPFTYGALAAAALGIVLMLVYLRVEEVGTWLFYVAFAVMALASVLIAFAFVRAALNRVTVSPFGIESKSPSAGQSFNVAWEDVESVWLVRPSEAEPLTLAIQPSTEAYGRLSDFSLPESVGGSGVIGRVFPPKAILQDGLVEALAKYGGDRFKGLKTPSPSA